MKSMWCNYGTVFLSYMAIAMFSTIYNWDIIFSNLENVDKTLLVTMVINFIVPEIFLSWMLLELPKKDFKIEL